MSKFKRFEDIEAWKKARVLTNDVYTITRKKGFKYDYELKSQIRRASMSIMLNIAEGFARRTNKEFALFLTHAHGSVAEVQSALYVALDQEYLTKKNFSTLYNQADEISRIVMGLIIYLRRRNDVNSQLF